jgi:hypothetical protein
MGTDVFSLKVFPPADVFPMLTNDELKALADDIAENGLKEPLVIADIEGEEMLIDGRNRREACKIAKVKPEVRKLNGEDPTAFVISANVHRRHMTKSQRAMAVAMIYPEPGKGGRGKKSASSNSEVASGFSDRLIQQARYILANAPDLVKQVMDTSITVQAAYDEVQERLSEANSSEARLAQLRERFPDIAELVEAGKLTIAAAFSEVSERQRQDAEVREYGKRSAHSLENETTGHIANVMAAIAAGEKKLFDRRKIAKLIENLKYLLEEYEAKSS